MNPARLISLGTFSHPVRESEPGTPPPRPTPAQVRATRRALLELQLGAPKMRSASPTEKPASRTASMKAAVRSASFDNLRTPAGAAFGKANRRWIAERIRASTLLYSSPITALKGAMMSPTTYSGASWRRKIRLHSAGALPASAVAIRSTRSECCATRINVVAMRLSVPARHPRDPMCNVLDLDVERRRIEQIETAARQHPLPGA